MKISASKKQLAKIISENGGWRDVAKFAAQDQDGEVFFYAAKPTRFYCLWRHQGVLGGDWINFGKALPNWHQTILSRDEYSNLYPAPDADGWIEWKGGECPIDGQTMIDVKFRYGACATSGADCFNFTHDDHKASDIIAYRLHKPEDKVAAKPECTVIDPEPTIEQLAAEYRNRLDYAERKQQEADAAKAEAEAKLAELVAAGKAVGLVLSVAAREPELIITDWWDLRVGDEIATTSGRKLTVTGLRQHDESWPISAYDNGGSDGWCVSAHDWRFIRRPSKGADNV